MTFQTPWVRRGILSLLCPAVQRPARVSEAPHYTVLPFSRAEGSLTILGAGGGVRGAGSGPHVYRLYTPAQHAGHKIGPQQISPERIYEDHLPE